MKKVVLLVGCPGSGKSTYCEKFLHGYTRVSRDDQGKRHKEAFAEALRSGDDYIVVDKTNHTRFRRRSFLQAAKEAGYTTKIVWLNTPRSECLKRAMSRKGHKGLAHDNVEKAIEWYYRGFEQPVAKEADEFERLGDPPVYVPIVDLTEQLLGKRYMIVGDVHGCLDELLQMLEDREFDLEKDVLISAGDLVDRGPLIKDTLEFVMSLPNFFGVKGNHDDKIVRYFSGDKMKESRSLQTTIDSFGGKMPDKTVSFLRDLPLILKTPAGYVVHAGFSPLAPPEQQDRRDCLYIRYFGGEGYFDEYQGILWQKLWPKDYPRVFYGHMPSEGAPIANAVSLDGGCVFGDYLKAWDSRDDIVHYVNAKAVYWADKGTKE